MSMRSTNLVGAAMIRFGKYAESSYAGLAAPTVLSALADSGLSVRDVDEVFCGHSFGGPLTGQRVVKEIGLGGLPVTNVENACSSGATALHLACRAVETGQIRAALIIGVEKLNRFGGGTLPLPAEDWEATNGVVMPAIYAIRKRLPRSSPAARRYKPRRQHPGEPRPSLPRSSYRTGSARRGQGERKKLTLVLPEATNNHHGNKP